MSIPIIDTLKPFGKFPAVRSEDVDVSGATLDEVLETKANTTELTKKVDKVSGKSLSTNDYDNAEKAKVAKLNEMFSIVD